MTDAHRAGAIHSRMLSTSEATVARFYQEAARHLRAQDPALGAVIDVIGPCQLAERQRTHHLLALLSAIVSQQLSTKAAATIFARVRVLLDDDPAPSAQRVLALEEAALRGAGLSGQKVQYVRDLCARVADGRLDLEALDTLEDDAVVARLTAVKGFGRWTAEMFLMFRLHRPDVLPVGDLGIVKAVARLYGLPGRPDAATISAIGDAWRPYRSVASWYLWQSLTIDPDVD